MRNKIVETPASYVWSEKENAYVFVGKLEKFTEYPFFKNGENRTKSGFDVWVEE